MILEDIKVVKQQYAIRIEQQPSLKKDLLKTFREEVSDRIDFIKFINSNLTKKIITNDFLKELWKDIVEDPLDVDERDLLFKWLRELADE